MIEHAAVDWEAGAPRSISFGDIYFSGDGIGEARHVFIDGNGLAERFASAQRFCIGELGFGTGLNVLVAADLWRRTKKPECARLDILSFEKFSLSISDLERAHRLWPQLADLSAPLLAAYPPLIRGVHRLSLADDVTLHLAFGDACEMLTRTDASVDAWFLDGFAPGRNPELWTPEIFREVARLSTPQATAATFTVAATARRALSESGFTNEKRAGYGRKREMLTARLSAPQRVARRAPWFTNENLQPLAPGAEIAIVGGGIAGACVAYEARRAGLKPTIVDPRGIAAGASGNPAGLIMPRLDLGGSAVAEFFLAAYVHSLRAIASLEAERGERFFNACGVFLKATTKEERQRHEKIVSARLLPDGWIERRDDGLFFPQAGVVDPVRYCRALAGGAPPLRRAVAAMDCSKSGVSLSFDDGDALRFDAVVLANGCDTLRFREARSLPLSAIAGQIDWFPDAPPPPHAIAFGPYAAPAPGGGLVIGATYEPAGAAREPAARFEATCENLHTLGDVLPALVEALDPRASRPRASIRCTTPDRTPVCGPLPDWDFYSASYDGLRFGRREDYPRAHVIPSAFILSGLGSRGLVTAPLAAAMLVGEMTGPPALRDFAEALHPARFLIRDLKRSRARLPLTAASGLTA